MKYLYVGELGSNDVKKRWKAGYDPEKIRCGCCLSALTGLATIPPVPTFRERFKAFSLLTQAKTHTKQYQVYAGRNQGLKLWGLWVCTLDEIRA